MNRLLKLMLGGVLALTCVCGVAAVSSTDRFDFNKLSTEEEFTEYINKEEGVYEGRRFISQIYLASLKDNSDYDTFAKWVSAFNTLEKSNNLNVGLYSLYKYTLEGPITPLKALVNEGYAYAVETNSKYIAEYLWNNDFCKVTDIDNETRINSLVNIMIRHTYKKDEITKCLTLINNNIADMEDEDVIKLYKKLYRKYYRLMQTNSDEYSLIVTDIVATLKSYGYDVYTK